MRYYFLVPTILLSLILGNLTLAAAPTPVKNLRATNARYVDKVKLSWQGRARGATYEVFRGKTEADLSLLIGGLTRGLYDDTTAIAGLNYYYRVDAVNSDTGERSQSSLVYGSRKLVGPTRLKASRGRFTDKVQLTWRPIELPSGYHYDIYRSEVGHDNWKYLASVTEDTFDDKTAKPGVKYNYRMFTVGQVDGRPVYSPNSNKNTGFLRN